MKNVKFLLALLALLICFFGCSAVSAQTLTVTGKVLDNDGLEAIGATVRIMGNPKVGAITDLDGKYSIQAKPKDILVFSYIGMATQEVPVKGKKVIDVQ